MSSELSALEARHAAAQKQFAATNAKIRTLLRTQPSSTQLRAQLRTWLGKRAADSLLAGAGFGSGPIGGPSHSQAGTTLAQASQQQASSDLMYLQLQSEMQEENRSYAAVSNIMKTKADTIRNSISNIR